MGAFVDALHLTDEGQVEKLKGSAIDMMAKPRVVAVLPGLMARDHIGVGENHLVGAGALGMVLSTVNQENKDIHGAATRIDLEGPLSYPLEHPIVLRSIFKKRYGHHGYSVSILPFVPDTDRKVTVWDIKRTIRVLMATNQEGHLVDISEGNEMSGCSFVFLKGKNGKLLRYSHKCSDPDFRDQPIAFIRDGSGCPADLAIARDWWPEKLDSQGNKIIDDDGNIFESCAARFMRQQFEEEIGDVAPAPASCIEDCKQQYAITARLAQEVERGGIKPNKEIPRQEGSYLQRILHGGKWDLPSTSKGHSA